MPDCAEVIADCMDMLRAGEFESGYHGLLDLDADAIPLLMGEFARTGDGAIRAVLVEVVWHFRDPDTVGFLGSALFDPCPEVWKQALDGLVTISGPDAADHLRKALAMASHKEVNNGLTAEWLQEALAQVNHGEVPPEIS